MLFICYPKCSTCQKAQKWLDAKGVAYELRNIKEQKPTADELRAWYKMSGLPLKKFFNTSGLIYKDLGLKDKLPALSEEEQLALLATDGMLVKRPLLIGDGFALAGFREADWERALNAIPRCRLVYGKRPLTACKRSMAFCAILDVLRTSRPPARASTLW
mgnify:CR=1 FL=1